MTRTQPAARPDLLSALTPDALAAADRRYPKWATMCQLRRLGLPVLDAVLITPGQDREFLDAALATLATATGHSTVMVRSDGGTETRRYYKGGNTFPVPEAASKAAGLLEAGRAVILMEPTSRFTNQLSALLRMDRDGRYGTFTIEALGPGYDVADLTRGGIPPQVTVTADISWSGYQQPWWTDLRLAADTAPGAEQRRRQQRLARIATDILTDIGHLTGTPASEEEKASLAQAWLLDHGHRDLWQRQDTAAAVACRARGWLDDAYLIAACHPHRGWSCLATATSDLGHRAVYWDIIDGSRKYTPRTPA
jgi:hypothetical protein